MENKILIIPGNTDLNRGDQALVWESVNIIKEVIPNVEVYLYNSGKGLHEINLQTTQTKKLGFHFLHRVLQHPRGEKDNYKSKVHYSKLIYIRWGYKALKNFITTFLLLAPNKLINNIGFYFLNQKQKETITIFPHFKAIIVKGGGFLHSYGKIRDIYLMYFFLFDILLAHKYGVKTIVLPNSIGPIKNIFARILVKKILKKCDFISIRESISAKYIQDLLKIQIKKYPDLAFFLKKEKKSFEKYLQNKGFDIKNKNIAITLRPYRFDGYKNHSLLLKKYLNEIKITIENLINDGYKVSLIAHTLGPSAHEDDRIALKKVLKLINNKYLNSIIYIEDFEINCIELQRIYSYYDMLIGTRFHSVIFALNVDVPAIAIAYGGNKSFGIMHDIGVSDYVIGIENISASKLTKLYRKLENEKELYLDKVHSYKRVLSIERNNLIKDIKSKL